MPLTLLTVAHFLPVGGYSRRYAGRRPLRQISSFKLLSAWGLVLGSGAQLSPAGRNDVFTEVDGFTEIS